MKRVARQAVLPFGRRERVTNRQIRQRIEGQKVTPGPGRPKKRKEDGPGRVSHQARPWLGEKTALHITVKLKTGLPNLRTRRRFNAVKRAFIKFSDVRDRASRGTGFRLVHFSVLSNHCHFIAEADSKRSLSMGMQKLLHSISRRLNALSVKERGGSVWRDGGSYKNLPGWLGRIFIDRYFAKPLTNPTQMAEALRYVAHNAQHHYGSAGGAIDPCSSFAPLSATSGEGRAVVEAKGYLLERAYRQLLRRLGVRPP